MNKELSGQPFGPPGGEKNCEYNAPTIHFMQYKTCKYRVSHSTKGCESMTADL